MNSSSVNGRLSRLEALAQPAPATGDEDANLEIALRGFDDVRAWLEGGPAPDVHRIDDMVRVPIKDGIAPANVAFFEALARLILTCVVRRYQDLTGNEPDERTFDEFAEADPVSRTWEYNAIMLLEHSETIRAGGASNFLAVRLIFPLTPWCKPDCPKQWAGPERYPEWWQDCLEFEERYHERP